MITGIYKIVSPTGKIYIGKSVNITKRFHYYRSLNNSCKRQRKLYNSLVKHGPENHNFYILHECTEAQLNGLEKYYINIHNSFNSLHGLNLRSGGGKSSLISDDTKRKLSESAKNRKYSKEGLIKMSLCQMGKYVSKSTRLRMSLSAKGKHFKNNTCLKVSQILDGKVIKNWDSLSKAARQLKIQKANISRSLNTNYKAGGFLWITGL